MNQDQEPVARPPNPIRLLRFMTSLDVVSFAPRVGLTRHQLNGLETGNLPAMREEWRAGFVGAGYDFDDLRRKYAAWRDERLGTSQIEESGRVRDAGLTDEARGIIAAAIERGARGPMAIARESGQSFATVQAFLRSGVA